LFGSYRIAIDQIFTQVILVAIINQRGHTHSVVQY